VRCARCLLALVLAAAGCAPELAAPDARLDTASISTTVGSDGGSGSSLQPALEAGTSGAGAGVDATPAPCPATALAPGSYGDRTLTVGGVKRSYDLHLPPGATGQRLPLVLYLHPLRSAKGYLQTFGRGNEKADSAGFIAVYPNGLGASWNAGACCGPSNGASGQPLVDDVGFMRALVAEVSTLACVDPRRVYATGFSNGGFLSHRLACEASDLFAAVAPVSAVMGMPTCTPARPMPVLMINGTADLIVPYNGGMSFPLITAGAFISVEETFTGWRQRDGCTGEPVETLSKGNARCLTAKSCAGGVEVTQCTIQDAGHCWFGEFMCVMGTNSSDLVATDVTWEFLSRFTLP